jgi:peptidoglycan/LPS O-acetylase OafA/YrhL
MNNKINSIQMLRALAVILVIYNHSMIICIDNKYLSVQQNFLYLQHWTSIGLDLFFVISGLIMAIVARSYSRKPSGWFNFFLKRVVRIIPLYWLYSTVVYFERHIIKHAVEPGEIVKRYCSFLYLRLKTPSTPLLARAGR